jgi:hypothetical protein
MRLRLLHRHKATGEPEPLTMPYTSSRSHHALQGCSCGATRILAFGGADTWQPGTWMLGDRRPALLVRS